jgi:t-SNARE complex subunit (syntaxin)
MEVANDFQIASETFRESLRRRIRRQAEIVKPDITEVMKRVNDYPLK